MEDCMADVTVASTTDDQAAVNAAAGLSAAASQEQQQEENQPGSGEQETQTTTQEAEAEAEGQEAEGEEEHHEEPRRPKNAVQKRIDKLTARNYALEEERNQLTERLTRLEQTVNQQPADKQPQSQANQFSKPKPVSTDPKFKDYDEYTDALTDWKLEKLEWDKQQKAAAEQQTVLAQRQAETFKAYNQAVSEVRGVHDDFDEVVGRTDLQLPMAVQVAIVGMRDKGPEISYQVAKDEELCNHLCDLALNHGDAVALTEFGRWLASVEEPEGESVAVGGGGNERPVARTSSKPAPIRPVGNSSTRSQLSLDELPFRDYRRIRDEAEKARFRH
jgi:hypothetical protein